MAVIIDATTGIDKVQDNVIVTNDIVNGAVTADKLAPGAVTAGKLANGSIAQANLASGVAGTGPAFSAYQGTGTTVNTATATKILFDTEEWDTNGNFSSSRFTPTVEGYYLITSAVCGQYNGNSYPMIYKNGNEYKRGAQPATSVNFVTYPVAALVYMNGSTDYVEIYFANNSGTNVTTLTGISLTYFQGALVRAA